VLKGKRGLKEEQNKGWGWVGKVFPWDRKKKLETESCSNVTGCNGKKVGVPTGVMDTQIGGDKGKGIM